VWPRCISTGPRAHYQGMERAPGTRARWEKCDHMSPVMIARTDEGYRAWCLLCGVVGPERDTDEEALRALREMAAR
jgi:hypothetical protein